MKTIRILAVAATLVLAGTSVMACGGPDAKTAKITPGDMPAGEAWTGVYFHPTFGYLHLVEQGNNVIGKWQRTDKSAWGQLSGTKVGNVLHFEWTEHKYGLVGPSSMQHGRGVFVYEPGKQGIAELKGYYGLDEDETGSTWNCVKQLRMQPDLDSITGETPGGSVQQPETLQ